MGEPLRNRRRSGRVPGKGHAATILFGGLLLRGLFHALFTIFVGGMNTVAGAEEVVHDGHSIGTFRVPDQEKSGEVIASSG